MSFSPAPWCWGCRRRWGKAGERETWAVRVAWLDGDVQLGTQTLGCCSEECALALAAIFVATERPNRFIEVLSL